MTYQFTFNPTFMLFLMVYIIWFLLPFLLRIKENMSVNKRNEKVPFIITAMVICFAVIITALFFRMLSLVFQTLQEWFLNITVFLLDSIFNDKTKSTKS